MAGNVWEWTLNTARPLKTGAIYAAVAGGSFVSLVTARRPPFAIILNRVCGLHPSAFDWSA